MNKQEQILPPSKIIKEEMKKRGLTQADIALITGRYQNEISLYLTKEKINLKFAKELALILGETPEYWLSLENKYRLLIEDEISEETKKRNSFIQEYPLKEMQKRGWINKTDNLDEITPQLESLIERSQKLKGVTLFKRTLTSQELNVPESLWLGRAMELAEMLPVENYNENRLDALFSLLKKATKSSKAVHKVAELLQRYGIRFVINEKLKNAQIDGAAFWLDKNSPVIALSLRFDNIGSFWFALMHELMHIKHRDSFSIDNLRDAPPNEIEEERNKEAAEFLVPQHKLTQFINTTAPYYSKAAINNFATQINVHPGIIVGQLQNRDEFGYDKHRDSLAKVRELATMTAFTDGWGHPVPVANRNK